MKTGKTAFYFFLFLALFASAQKERGFGLTCFNREGSSHSPHQGNKTSSKAFTELMDDRERSEALGKYITTHMSFNG